MVCPKPTCKLKGAYVRKNKLTGGKEIYCRMCDTVTPIIEDINKKEE